MPADAPAATDASCTDPYGAATAEFYDLLATHEWERVGDELREVFAGVDAADGPLLDLGAGTGVGLSHIRAAVPGAAVHAIEPSKAMRVALHARLASDPELRSAVTVDPRPFAAASLPERSCALLMSAVIGHLDDDEREQVWRYVAEHMPVGAPAAVQLLPPDRPVTVPPTRYSRVDVGRFAYEGWQEGEPVGERHMRWTMTYRVLDRDDDDRTVAEYVGSARWRCLGVADLRAETEPFGLAFELIGDFAVLRPR